MSNRNTSSSRRQASAQRTDIRVGRVVVGHVAGDVFYKSISGSRHMLRTPRAIAFDLQSLRDAEAAGAAYVEVTDTDTHKTYRAPLGTVWARGFELDRGYGRQQALVLSEWNKGDVAQQLDLFSVAG